MKFAIIALFSQSHLPKNAQLQLQLQLSRVRNARLKQIPLTKTKLKRTGNSLPRHSLMKMVRHSATRLARILMSNISNGPVPPMPSPHQCIRIKNALLLTPLPLIMMSKRLSNGVNALRMPPPLSFLRRHEIGQAPKYLSQINDAP